METTRPYRVLSISGGGMRGLYTARYLFYLGEEAKKRLDATEIDIGKAFDMIVGTSTGAIIACALAKGTPMSLVVKLYREHGRDIFPCPVPRTRFGGLWDTVFSRRRALARGARALEAQLRGTFGDETLKQVYERRKVALEITSVDMIKHGVRVFKTPHQTPINTRDSNYSLVDVCLASTAAPIFRSLAAIHDPGDPAVYKVFADGGLYANNPIMIALIDSLEAADPQQPIAIFSLGTCKPQPGEIINEKNVHRTLPGWWFGALAAELSINAQDAHVEKMPEQLFRYLSKHLGDNRLKVTVTPFPRNESIPTGLSTHLGLDNTDEAALSALVQWADLDAEMALNACAHSNDPKYEPLRKMIADATAKLPISSDSSMT